MKEPVDHILRPKLPWRDSQPMTECGINAASLKTLTREEFAARLKEYGQQRTAILTCMTCTQTYERYRTWEEEPREALHREIEFEGYRHWRRKDRGEELLHELRAIERLIASHKDEFTELIRQSQVVSTFDAESADKGDFLKKLGIKL